MATNPEVFDFDIGDVTGEKGDTGNGIKSIQLLSTSGLNKTYRITMTDDTTFDFVVTDGNGITGATFNAQTNALTLTFQNGTTFTTPSLKGATGKTPEFSIGMVGTGEPDDPVRVVISGTPENPVLSFNIPRGHDGADGDDYVLTTADKEEIADLVEELVEVTVTGTIATIAALKNHRYICGELASLDVTSLPTSGLVDILFTSGSTATVVTLPATVHMPAWFEIGANITVEISILDGVWGSVQVWE